MGNVVSSRPCLGGVQAYNDCIGSWKSNYLATTMAPKNQYKYTLVLTLTNHKRAQAFSIVRKHGAGKGRHGALPSPHDEHK
jgi:hypothetical protein